MDAATNTDRNAPEAAMDIITASPMKLRDGSWGARVPSSDVVEGQTIRIRTRAGKTWEAVVTRIQECSPYDSETQCATRSLAPRPVSAAPVRHSHGGRCRECGGQIKDYPQHRAMAGLCGICAFDEY